MNHKSILIISLFCITNFLHGMNNVPDQNDIDIANAQLLYAATKGNLVEVKQLISEGIANLNTKKSYNLQTPLIRAANYGNTDIAKALIKAGADVNAIDVTKETALIYAVKYENTRLVNALINAGADVTIKHQNGLTSFEYAIITIPQRITSTRRNYKINAIDKQTIELCTALIHPVAKSIIRKKVETLLMFYKDTGSLLSTLPKEILKIIITISYPEFAMDHSTITKLPPTILADNISFKTLALLTKNKILNKDIMLRIWQNKLEIEIIEPILNHPSNENFINLIAKMKGYIHLKIIKILFPVWYTVSDSQSFNEDNSLTQKIIGKHGHLFQNI